MTDTIRSHTDEQVEEFRKSVSNWGRWGADDEMGTLNLITPEKMVQAAALVRKGVSVSLAYDLNVHQGPMNPRPAIHIMQYMGPNAGGAVDFLGLQCHGLATTHVDALCHVWIDGPSGTFYNGFKISDHMRISGPRKCAIDNLRDGVVTRGVLLDIAGAMGKEYLDSTERIHVEDLELAEKHGNVQVQSGDAMIVRVGSRPRMDREGVENVLERGRPNCGLDADCVPWIRERDVALYSGDCLDASPGYKSAPLHGIANIFMGLTTVDAMSVEDLAKRCVELKRWEFMFTFAPLRLRHGTGTAVNPLAVF